jgi:hypothetical protein
VLSSVPDPLPWRMCLPDLDSYSQCCRSGIFIRDPTFSIPDLWSRVNKIPDSYSKCCGSGILIRDPTFSIPDLWSRVNKIPGPGSRVNMTRIQDSDLHKRVKVLKNKIRDIYPGSRILILSITDPGSGYWIHGSKKAPDPGVNKGGVAGCTWAWRIQPTARWWVEGCRHVPDISLTNGDNCDLKKQRITSSVSVSLYPAKEWQLKKYRYRICHKILYLIWIFVCLDKAFYWKLSGRITAFFLTTDQCSGSTCFWASRIRIH